MTLYEPVTDIGKAIAKALTKDDGIRLDVHDILEKWEGSLKHIEEHPHHYNPEEAIRIAESIYPLLFSGRYVLSNMRQMKERIQLLEGRLTDLLLRFKGEQEKLEAVRLLWEEAKETKIDVPELLFRLGEILEEEQ